jgi:O-antigen ligase
MVVMSFGGFRKKVLNIFIIGAIGVFLFAVVGDLFIPYFKGRGDAAYAPIVVQGSEMEIYFGSNILGRLYIHELAIRKFVNSPLFGYGFGAQLEGALMNFGHAHNSYLSALYNLGVFGFITYLIILVRIIRVVNLKIRERDQVDEVTCFMIGFLSWFVSLLVMSLFESVLFSFYEIIVVLVFMLGIIANVPSNEVAKEDGRRFLGNDIVLGGLQTRSVK